MFFLHIIAICDPFHGDLFAYLLDTYANKLFALLSIQLFLAGLESRETAKDLLQETFLKVYRHIGRFADLDAEATEKLLSIYAKNTARDHIRKYRSSSRDISLYHPGDENDEPIEFPAEDASPEEIIIHRELIQTTAALIDCLPEEQRYVILLKYQYGYKNKEIAQLMNLSETCISSRLNRAKLALKKMMEENGYGN